MLTITLWLILFYLTLCALAFIFQGTFIFPGAGKNPQLYSHYATQEFKLQRDKITLQGWRLENTALTNSLVIIYFGGNAEDVVSTLPKLQKMGAAFGYAFNYRGYGHSQGKASQKSLYADALSIYDEIAARHSDNSQTRFIIIGRSLGSAVAGYIANHRKTDALVLMTPLKSASVNGKRMLPFLPVGLLIRHPLDLKTQAAEFTCPVLMLIADVDAVIPPQDSLETFAAIQSEKQLLRLQGVGHNNLFDNPNALKAIQTFIAELNTAP